MYPTTTPLYRLPISLTLILLCGLALCLVAFQPPPSNGTGSGNVHVQARSLLGTPLSGVTVRYLDEWNRQPYADCTTDLAGDCRLRLENVPALGEMVRGVVEVGGGRVQDAMFLDGESITIRLVLDANGTLTHGADVLATRDPHLTPTLIGVEAALATLTAAASEPLATPSPGIERTVAAAHQAMTATTVARASLTPTPHFTPTPSGTPNVGVAVMVNNTSLPGPRTSAPREESPAEGVTFAELSALLVRLVLTLMGGGILLVAGGAWWMRRRTGGAK